MTILRPRSKTSWQPAHMVVSKESKDGGEKPLILYRDCNPPATNKNQRPMSRFIWHPLPNNYLEAHAIVWQFQQRAAMAENSQTDLVSCKITPNMSKICNSDMKLCPQKHSRSHLFLLIEISYLSLDKTSPCQASTQRARAVCSTLTLWVQPVRVFVRHTQYVPAQSWDNTRAHPLSRQ